MKLTVKQQLRFWDKVQCLQPNDCWFWQSTTTRYGYGQFKLANKQVSAHRVMYELVIGKVPKTATYHGLCVMHSCDNRNCVNPQHLFLGTQKDNVQDAETKGRRPRFYGMTHGNHKLTSLQVAEIRRSFNAGGKTKTYLGQVFDVSDVTIGNIVRNLQRTKG